LKERLRRAQVAHPNDSVAEEVEMSTIVDDEAELDFNIDGEGRILPEDDTPAGSSKTPTKRLRAQFGRARTHTEQIIVAPCGMILARETFYGAEAVSSVVVCVKFKCRYLLMTTCP
jgi:hypothetical protein